MNTDEEYRHNVVDTDVCVILNFWACRRLYIFVCNRSINVTKNMSCDHLVHDTASPPVWLATFWKNAMSASCLYLEGGENKFFQS
jgi:hypothetical protein